MTSGTSDSLRLLLLNNLYPPDSEGGMEVNAQKLANGLRARGHDVQVVTSRFRRTFEGDPPAEPEWVHRILRFAAPMEIRKGRLRNKWEMASALVRETAVAKENTAAVREFLKGRRFDLAYCMGLFNVSPATVAPISEAGIPILWNLSGNFLADRLHSKWTHKLVLNTLVRKWHRLERTLDFSHIIFVSAFLRDYFANKGFRLEKTYVIPRGFEREIRFDAGRARAEPPTFVSAGRLEENKGLHILIDAARTLHLAKPELPWRLSIIGPEIPAELLYAKRLRRAVEEFGLADRVRFEGKVDRIEVLERMRDATAVVLPTLFMEPFANTMLEGLAQGTPFVGSRCGAAAEVIEHGNTGLLYDPHDAQTLARHLQALLEDPGLVERLGRAGAELVRDRFSLPRVLDLTEAAIREAIADHRAPSSQNAEGSTG